MSQLIFSLKIVCNEQFNLGARKPSELAEGYSYDEVMPSIGVELPAGPPRRPVSSLDRTEYLYINNNINCIASFHEISREKGLTLACLVNPNRALASVGTSTMIKH